MLWSDFIKFSAGPTAGIIIASTLDDIEFEKARDSYNIIFVSVRIVNNLFRRSYQIDKYYGKKSLAGAKKNWTYEFSLSE